MTRPLSDVLEAQRAEERRRALRALLRYPLLTAQGPDEAAFRLVRKHGGWLRDWFTTETGWSLLIDTELARLRKVPASNADATRPAASGAVTQPKVPFSRRRYVLACLALAALERAEAQVTLGWLAERILTLVGDPVLATAGISFTLTGRDERADLVAVARLLLSVRVLSRVAGDEQAYVNASGDALYDVNRRVLAALLVGTRGPSTVDAVDFERRLAALTEPVVPVTEEGRNRAIRHALARRLLDDPVVYYRDLSEEEQAYLASQRAFVLRRLAEATGLVAEARAEGMALVDPSGEVTDLGMPDEGTEGHATLLLADYLVGRGEPVPVEELARQVAGYAGEYRSYWRKAAAEPGGEVPLTRLAVDRLVALGLVRMGPEGVEPLPALSRYRYAGATVVSGQSR
jgi:uncharacterized protein (TIGR02678 family)